MSTVAHDNHSQPVASGNWEDASWEFYFPQTAADMPDPKLCTAVACIAIYDLDAGEVVLTHNENPASNYGRYGTWEILSGHIDPLDPNDPEGPRESFEQAMAREAVEEGGFRIKLDGNGALKPEMAAVFGRRQIVNHSPRSNYPPVSFMAYYWAASDAPLEKPTDEVASKVFGMKAMSSLVEQNLLGGSALMSARHTNPA